MPLPTYKLVINEEDHTGVTAVALVDNPAIEINWQSFSAQKPLKFETVSQEQRIIAGPLMVADMLIYRSDKRGEYNVYFDAQTITQIVDKFHKNQYEKNVNPMHESMLILPDIYMRSDFQINSKMGILTPKGFPTLSDGSWFGMFKVNNDEVWNDYIKTGTFRGFSVEGFFDEIPITEKPAEPLTDAEASLVAKILS